MFSSLWRHRHLAVSLIHREISSRYRGSMLGLLWSFVTPLLLLLVYTFVFSVVFKARWVTAGAAQASELNSKAEFALILLAGLMVYNFFAECINRAPTLVVAHANYVKKVVFPLDLLAWVAIGSALFHLAVSLLVWLLAYIALYGWPPLTSLLLPIVWLPLIFYTLGLTWLLASLGVFIRDIAQAVAVLTGTLMFLSPIFYPISALPQEYQAWLYFNPLTPMIEMTREVLYFNKIFNGLEWFVMLALSLALAYAGHYWFEKTRKGFADVL